MIVKQYIKEFENLGLGVFVHFGIYSVLGCGEWAKTCLKIESEEYEKLAYSFCPQGDWAEQLVKAAKKSGAKYITLTSRHHDGFSLYDTMGLSDFDAPEYCGRDLVKEFVDACRKMDILPFFYHTLVDWHDPRYKTNFTEYLQYLRESVKILCTQYGKIGGFWFDGTWDNPGADWEEDKLYSMIRTYQPDAMIINNTGMDALGALGHIELDSVTFERGNPRPINLANSPKYIASEMCQVMNDHWGYARNDFKYLSMGSIITELVNCRRYGANYLLNVGPMGNGALRLMDQAILETLGAWVEMHEEALRTPKPTSIEVKERPDDFILKDGNVLYLFVLDAPSFSNSKDGRLESFCMSQRIVEAQWLDNGESLWVEQIGDACSITATPFLYGTNLVVRIAKIITE